ncbi:MAG: Spo0B domain-containing protein [Bacillaceae bacterium]|nr:Spo0B domain-containing protein [Bacillaceae bacterium]
MALQIAYTIFETLIVLLFTLTILGYKVKDYTKNIMLFTLLFVPFKIAIVLFQVPDELRIFVFVAGYILLLRILLFRKMKESLLVGLFAGLVLHTLLTPFIFTTGSQSSLTIHTSITPWIALTFLFFLTLYTTYRNISIPHVVMYLNDRKYHLLFVVTILLMFQTIITTHSTGSFYYQELTSIGIWLDLMSAGLIITYLIIFIKMSQSIESKHMDHSESYLQNVEDLLLSVRSQRHDYLNHLQVIHSYSKLNRFDDIKQYLDDMIKDVRGIGEYLEINHPALAALLRAKESIAATSGIRFEIKILSRLQSISIRPFDLVKVVGNLIDNALEEEQHAPVDKRLVKVTIDQFNKYNEIKIYNANSYIDQHKAQKIFEPGYSTKFKHSGIGLAVSKKLLDQHGGRLEMESKKNVGTLFRVILPIRSP